METYARQRFDVLDPPGTPRGGWAEAFHAFNGGMVQFSTDGEFLVAGVADHVYVYDSASGTLEAALALPPETQQDVTICVRSVAVSSIGLILAGDNGGHLTGWDSTRGYRVSHLQKCPTPLFVEFFGQVRSGRKRFWRAADQVHPLAIGAGGTAVTRNTERNQVLDGPDGREGSPYVEGVAGCRSGRYLAVARNEHWVHLYERQPDSTYSCTARTAVWSQIQRIVFSRDTALLYVAMFGGAAILTVPDLDHRPGFEGAGNTGDLALLGDDAIVTAHGSGHDRGSVRVWSVHGEQ